MVELTMMLAVAVLVVVAVWQRWWEFLIPSPPYMKMDPRWLWVRFSPQGYRVTILRAG